MSDFDEKMLLFQLLDSDEIGATLLSINQNKSQQTYCFKQIGFLLVVFVILGPIFVPRRRTWTLNESRYNTDVLELDEQASHLMG